MTSLTDVVKLRGQSIAASLQAQSIVINTGMVNILPQTVDISSGFNMQCRQAVENYHAKIEVKSDQVRAFLETHPETSNRYYRSWAVDKAWEMERLDVEWGGRGSENWNRSERAEILRRGRIAQEKVDGVIVKEYPGHHQQSVAYHPEEQGNPDNIKFYRSREEHIQKGHAGDLHNESDAPMLDRGKMLEKTNKNRVIKNEAGAAGLTAIIAFVTTASLSFIAELVKNGDNPEKIKRALKCAGRNGFEGACVALFCYGTSRLILEPATNSITSLLTKLGISVPIDVIKGGIISTITIIITGIFSFIKLKKAGLSTKYCLRQVGKQMLLSAAISAVVIYIGFKYGNIYGLIISLGISAILFTFSLIKMHSEKKLFENIRQYMIEDSYFKAKEAILCIQ